jgi:hypothetical protein
MNDTMMVLEMTRLVMERAVALKGEVQADSMTEAVALGDEAQAGSTIGAAEGEALEIVAEEEVDLAVIDKEVNEEEGSAEGVGADVVEAGTEEAPDTKRRAFNGILSPLVYIRRLAWVGSVPYFSL